jgi:membrane protease YdiL (CAAX protease family)
MLKRLRSAHPMLYCLVAEVLFLGMLFVASLLSLLLILFVVRDIDAVDDYMLTFMQEAAGVLVAWLFLARTGKSGLLRRRGSGFFNGLLVGLYPIALISYNAYNTLLFGRPEGDMLPAWHVVWFLIGMTSVGVAEEFLFRGVIAQTLLEHFGTSRAGVWKACLLSGLYFGAAHLTNLTGSAPLGVLMQCVFAASLGTLLAAVYFRTGNIWVTVFIHAAMDITSMLIGGLYGTETVADSISTYDITMLTSIAVYLIPTAFLLRKKKLGEVELYFGNKRNGRAQLCAAIPFSISVIRNQWAESADRSAPARRYGPRCTDSSPEPRSSRRCRRRISARAGRPWPPASGRRR